MLYSRPQDPAQEVASDPFAIEDPFAIGQGSGQGVPIQDDASQVETPFGQIDGLDPPAQIETGQIKPGQMEPGQIEPGQIKPGQMESGTPDPVQQDALSDVLNSFDFNTSKLPEPQGEQIPVETRIKNSFGDPVSYTHLTLPTICSV